MVHRISSELFQLHKIALSNFFVSAKTIQTYTHTNAYTHRVDMCVSCVWPQNSLNYSTEINKWKSIQLNEQNGHRHTREPEPISLRISAEQKIESKIENVDILTNSLLFCRWVGARQCMCDRLKPKDTSTAHIHTMCVPLNEVKEREEEFERTDVQV